MATREVRQTGRSRSDDAGMTLVELLVAMAIFVVVIAVFMAGVVTMTKTTARAAGVSDATSSVRKVMDRFDKQVRYGTAINTPGTGPLGPSYYVEYLVPSQTAGATPVCVQWRYDPTARTMALRTWANSAPPSPSNWLTVATDVRNNLGTNPPFVFTQASPTSLHQQLTVSLDIGVASRPGATAVTNFVARNTTVDTPTNLGIVCQTGVGRP